MSDARDEALSALLDGEATELELRRLALDDTALQQRWKRWSEQRELLQGSDAGVFRERDISSQVAAAIRGEAPAKVSPVTAMARPLGGLAVAAAVAGLVVFGLSGRPGDSGAGVPAVVDSRVYPAQAVVSRGAVTASASAFGMPARPVAALDPASRERFQRYVQSHSERSIDNGGQGMLSYARTAAWQADY